jgi:hypothetical protein
VVDKIVRGVLTLGLAGASVYLALTGSAVPNWLLGLTGIAVGQYLPTPGAIKKGA